MLDRLARHSWMQLVLVVLVAACVYLPFLGVRPLDFSEGHRAVPGWTMLESHDFWHQKMFGLTYIRKPPGMAWAIVASSAWLGQTPLAARLPSAICAMLMSGIAWWFGRRWFGGGGVARAYQPVLSRAHDEKHGLVSPCYEEHGLVSPCYGLAGVSAGLAQALMPLMWSPGRTAEIEMLNNLGTQMFALGMVDLLVGNTARGDAEEQRESGPMAFLWELCASARNLLLPASGLVIAAFAKGPASATVLGGVFVGACIAMRSARPLASRGVWIALVFGACAITLLGMKFLIANNQPDAVREDVAGQFIWSGGRIVGVLTLLPLAWASALPAALALLVPFGTSRARAGANGAIARSLAWAWLIAVLMLVCMGVSNARYAMPAAVLLPTLVPYAINVLRPRLAALASRNAGIVGTMRWCVFSPVGWAGAMIVAAWWFVILTGMSATEDQRAGVRAAGSLAGFARASELWADDAIEARPDVLWLMHQESPRLQIRWAKGQIRQGELAPIGAYLLLRTDNQSQERARYAEHIRAGRVNQLGKAIVRRFEFTLYEVRGVMPSAER